MSVSIRRIVLAGFTAAITIVGLTSQASAVVLTQLQNQTISGQDFTFIFNAAPISNGTGGTFTLHVRGDYGDEVDAMASKHGDHGACISRVVDYRGVDLHNSSTFERSGRLIVGPSTDLELSQP